VKAGRANDEPARRRIRTSLDESLIVEAAAGAGKTTELLHRIVNTLRAGKTTVDRIVAVTFTRKAAGELRLRLRIELDAARTSARDLVEIRNLEDAVARLEEAHIGTIHSFCAGLLRQRPVEARIAPGFEELDEAAAERLYTRAFDAWIQEALGRMPDGLRRALSRAAAGNSREDAGPLEQIRTAGWALVQWRDFPERWRRGDFNQREEIDRLLPDVDALSRMAESCRIVSDPLRKHLRCVVDFAARRHRAEQFRPRDYDALESQLIQLSRDLRRRQSKGRGKFSTEFSREAVVAAEESLSAALVAFQRRSEADLAALLHDEMQSLVERYEAMKAGLGRLDFVDLLIRARDLIRDNAEVRRFMQEQFTHIFVDEFQDTDPVQAELLVLLSADDPLETDWRGVRPRPGKLFLVGDPKQSIYRFRRADILMYQDLCRLLQEKGVAKEHLTRSFRAVGPIQEAVNAAFAPEMNGDPETGQPAYVPLEAPDHSAKSKAGADGQPAIVVLPAPFPYGAYNISNDKIDKCLPQTVAAFVDWLIRESGWKVRNFQSDELIPVRSEHVAILFRRFMNWRADMTREYVHALEARNIPHLLWGARSFHRREEVETVRAALNAVEWPDDELSVYSALRGALFALSDSLLLRYREWAGSFHPFRPRPENLEKDFEPVAEALGILARLHRTRNRRPIVETVHELLEAGRAHAAFALRPSGNQALANVYRVCDLARSYELSDGFSFRGFVDRLNALSEREDAVESPVLEERAEGVRIMTLHAAKGLEFPVVILADMTANLTTRAPDKYVDADRRLCAQRLMGCSPWDLLDHEEIEHKRDAAEGVRVAYVAATRARDLLVVTAVGDGPREGSWLSPLNRAIYPLRKEFRSSEPAPKCPKFGEATVLARPVSYDGMSEVSVKPGAHRPQAGQHTVVWWDPAALQLDVDVSFGLRGEEILKAEKEGEDSRAAEGTAQYERWKSRRQQAVERGRIPSLRVFAATDIVEPPPGYAARVQVERVARAGRPKGARFGSLVHLVLRDSDFMASRESIDRIARSHARLLNAPEEEIQAACSAVAAALRHPLLERAGRSSRVYRELPVVIRDELAGLLEAVIDLAFLENSCWIVVDFKTDAEDPQRLKKYRRQVGWYVRAVEVSTGAPASGWLLHM